MNSTIFIADDSPTILNYFENLLGSNENEYNFFTQKTEASGTYDIHTFDDGDLLVNKFKEFYKQGKKVPLCILDMRMIRMDGLTTSQEIRKIDENVQIIIVTAFSDISIEEIRSKLDKDIYYIKKPFSEEEIIVLVQSLINNWNIRDEMYTLKQDYADQIIKLKKVNKEREEKNRTDKDVIENLQKELANLKAEIENISEIADDPKKLKTAFLLNMSHEIRTPMNAIVGFSDLLGDPDLTDDQREEFIELISNSGNDLLNLVDDIIDISRIDSGSFTLTKEKIDLRRILDELYKFFSEDIIDRKIKRIEIKVINELDNKDSRILSNEFRLKQIITKLLNNSLKFTKEGIIEFGVKRKDENFLLFYVKDNGLGMTDEKQDQLFDLFSEYDDSYTKKYGGTRSGMHLSKRLAEMLGGEMWIESKLDEGSTYFFTIPHETVSFDPTFKKAKSKPDYKFNWLDRTIVIAEDVEFNYLYLEEILNKTSAKILWAKNGQEAIYFFDKEEKIDLVLMDIQMPVMNGFEATVEIKKKFPDVPIVIQTAFTIDEEREKSKKAGANDFLSKPIKPADLYNTISKYLEN